MSDMDRELDRLLRELRDEALPESALEAVRSGVRTQIATGRRRRVAWMGLGLAAAAAAIACVAVTIPWTAAPLPLAAPRAPEVASIALAQPASPMIAGSSGVAGPDAMRQEARQKLGRSLKAAPPRGASSRHPTLDLDKVRREHDASLAGTAREEQTQFMRIITDDPNVVILWAMNSKGETR